MNMTARMAALAVAFALVACEEQPQTATTADFEKARAEVAARSPAVTAPLGSGAKAKGPADVAAHTDYGAGSANYRYDPTGKRDPFRSFVRDKLSEDALVESPLEQFELGQLTISGVVWQADRRRALVLDPAGQAYVVKTGDRIGKNDGVVTEIGDSSLVVLESYVDFHGDKTEKEIEMRIRQSTGG
jgi:type IV pilus assembly protein PilP